MLLARDTFHDTVATTLDAHIGDTGAGWSRIYGTASGSGAIDSTGTRIVAASAVASVQTPAVPVPDHVVEVEGTRLSSGSQDLRIYDRSNISATPTNYLLWWNDNGIVQQIALTKVVAGADAGPFVTTPFAWTVGTNLRLRLTSVNGSTSVTLTAQYSTDGGSTWTSAGTYTDSSSPLLAAGNAGLGIDFVGTNTTGVHVFDFLVSPALAVAPTDANWAYSPLNWAVGATAVTNRPGAKFRVGFTGKNAALGVDVSSLDTGAVVSGDYPWLLASVDDGPLTQIQLVPKQVAAPVASGLAAGSHTLEVYWQAVSGNYDRWGSTGVRPTLSLAVTGLAIDGTGASARATAPRPKKMIARGDSITEAQRTLGDTSVNSSVDATLSWATYVAEALNAELGIIAIGGGGFVQAGSGNTPPLFTPGNDAASQWDKLFFGVSLLSGGHYVTQPDYVIDNYGVNDSGQAAASVTASVAGWFAAERGAAPNALIVQVLPFAQTQGAAILAGLSQYANGYTVIPVDDMYIYIGRTDAAAALVDCGVNMSIGLSPGSPGPATEATTDGTHLVPRAQARAAQGGPGDPGDRIQHSRHRARFRNRRRRSQHRRHRQPPLRAGIDRRRRRRHPRLSDQRLHRRLLRRAGPLEHGRRRAMAGPDVPHPWAGLHADLQQARRVPDVDGDGNALRKFREGNAEC